MAQNPDNVLVPGTGSAIYLAPVGTTAPTSVSSALDAAFVDAGYISDDIPELGNDRESSEIRDWLGRLVRTVASSITRSVTLPLLETTPEALRLAFDGGTFTGVAGGSVKFVPGSSTQERAIVIHMVDGDSIFRIYIRRAIVSAVESVSPSAENGTVWNITLTVGDPGGGLEPIEIFTNIAAIVAASA